jgi:formylglycine-generating enzyme
VNSRIYIAVLLITMSVAAWSCASDTPAGPTPTVTYRLSGKVTTTDVKEVVGGVTVTLGTRTTATDTNGVYTFDSVAAGAYTLQPAKSGRVFSPATRQVNVSNADIAALDFEMTNPNIIPDDSIQMVLIPAGTFMMGVDADYSTHLYGSSPKHRVTLTRSFWMGIHEVTQAQWIRVMATNPSQTVGPNHPVEMITWNEAVEFCNRMSDLHGLDRYYLTNDQIPAFDENANGYRLPTEAEWEYAASAGDTSIWYGVDDVPPKPTSEQLAKLAQDQSRYAWIEVNSWVNGKLVTHPVGQLEPNAWGLYDMIGNATEMLFGAYAPYPSEDVVDPITIPTNIGRINRGGRYIGKDGKRESLRGRSDQSVKGEGTTGFRVVRNM